MTNSHSWFQNAIFYQLHVKCFYDANGDGIGDFKGLTQKLDHIQNLGCSAIWLLPFYESPLLDDGYDIADYYSVHPDYGTLKDFKAFLKEAHKRGLKVVTELVINHTSDQHQWFQRARQAKAHSKYRDYYVWSETPDKYQDARIIFKDFETSNWAWDHVAGAYYWHRFYNHQPDLNYDNPLVQKEIFKILDFWMKMGVDGMRLDAIPYLYQREGTDCENLPETHDFLKRLRKHVDKHYPNRLLLAEANQWPEQASAYFGDGDECHMAFHFPVMPRLFMALRMEDRFPLIDIIEQTPIIPESCQWAIFLRNHDELTLEMVTDEERDFMYHAYAKDPKARINLGIRRRLAPLLENDRKKIQLLYALLFSLPGSPIIYYGDEIGMGDNYYLGDRNGVRTPMQWNSDRNAGFSSASPQKLYLPLIIDPEYHHAYLNVETQDKSSSSLLWWMRRVINLRQQHQAFGIGDLTFIYPSNSKILAFIRKFDGEDILVVANLSRYSQYVELSLPDYVGCIPIDLFSLNPFATIRDPSSYGMTVGGYDFYWLRLEQAQTISFSDIGEIPTIELSHQWDEVLDEKQEGAKPFKKRLLHYFKTVRWFRSKATAIKDILYSEIISLGGCFLIFVDTIFSNDQKESYLLPLSFINAEDGVSFLKQYPEAVIAHISLKGSTGMIIDAVYDPHLHRILLESLLKRKKLKGISGAVTSQSGRILKEIVGQEQLGSQVLKAEQSNSAILFQDKLFFKLFRRLDEGDNPDIELVRYLSIEGRFPYVPSFAGAMHWESKGGQRIGLGLAQQYVPNGGDMWTYSLNVIRMYFEGILSAHDSIQLPDLQTTSLFRPITLPKEIFDQIGWMYLEMIKTLGSTTAQMHLALYQANKPTDLAPEAFTPFHQKALYQKMRTQYNRVHALLLESLVKLKSSDQEKAKQFLDHKNTIHDLLRYILTTKLDMMKIRIHGDFHLGQVLYTGKEPMIIDFEGEPALPLGERLLKRLALRDVASMIGSFHYAVHMILQEQEKLFPDIAPNLSQVGELWYRYVSHCFLQAYLSKAREMEQHFLPTSDEKIEELLAFFLLNKSIYEVGYELQNRPDWVGIPLAGVLSLLGESK